MAAFLLISSYFVPKIIFFLKTITIRFLFDFLEGHFPIFHSLRHMGTDQGGSASN